MRNFILTLSLVLIGSLAMAQPEARKGNFEKYKTQKISYMTERLEITPEEAQNFWPIYNEFDKAREQMHIKRRNLEERVKNEYDSLSEKDFVQINEEQVELSKQESALYVEYNSKFKEVLPINKVVLILPSENEFRFNMIKQYRESRRNNK